MKALERLSGLIGEEHEFADLSRELKFFVHEIRPAVVGALQVTCADETELECGEAFQRGVANDLLPRLKYGMRAPFRLANLGGQYQWGAGDLAEKHFATPEAARSFKLMIFKINSHVAVTANGHEVQYGVLRRYGTESACCGALHGLMNDQALPALEPLREDFLIEGHDRIAALRPTGPLAPLLAAVTSARLQARRAALEVQDSTPAGPTLTVILPCVTLNREGHDTELIVGAYYADRRDAKGQDHYWGLGDDPSQYAVVHPRGPLRLTDPGAATPRLARDHRQLILQEWRRRERRPPPRDARWKEILRATSAGKHLEGNYGRTLLKSALTVLAHLDPVSASVLLFASGATQIHHAARMHRIARETHENAEAQALLSEVLRSLDHLKPERARELLELLIDPQYGLIADP